MARTLRSLAQSPPGEREAAIEALFRQTLETQSVLGRWADYRKWSLSLRWLCVTLFVDLFIATPLVIYGVGLSRSWLPLLIGLLALEIAIAWRFALAHRALFPEASDQRFNQTLTILLTPAVAMRAPDFLSKPLLERRHPLAIAEVFCQKPAFEKFARAVLLDLRQPMLPVCPAPDPKAVETEQRSRGLWLRLVEQFLRDAGLNPDELAKAPARADDSCRSYCPRCQAQFVWVSGECADCGGVCLKAFDVVAEREPLIGARVSRSV